MPKNEYQYCWRYSPEGRCIRPRGHGGDCDFEPYEEPKITLNWRGVEKALYPEDSLTVEFYIEVVYDPRVAEFKESNLQEILDYTDIRFRQLKQEIADRFPDFVRRG